MAGTNILINLKRGDEVVVYAYTIGETTRALSFAPTISYLYTSIPFRCAVVAVFLLLLSSSASFSMCIRAHEIFSLT